MKTTNLVPVALFAALFFPTAAHAEVSLTSTVAVTATSPTVTATTTATVTPKSGLFRQFQLNRKEMREDVKENRKEIKEDVKEIRKDLNGTENPDKTDLRRKLLTTSQNGLLRSFTVRASALERYQKLIADRITQKLVKLPGNQDLLKAQASLGSDEQKTLWANFKADVAKYEVSIKAVATASDPKSLLNDLRTQAKKINEDLKAIRQFLVVDLRLVVKAK
ncbi:hypothetical protein HYV64_03740 [Candidatus Shapirobacteria bacterium]|nr:hypothetical protein [Candidatus Shapirobacteria bacterium]